MLKNLWRRLNLPTKLAGRKQALATVITFTVYLLLARFLLWVWEDVFSAASSTMQTILALPLLIASFAVVFTVWPVRFRVYRWLCKKWD